MKFLHLIALVIVGGIHSLAWAQDIRNSFRDSEEFKPVKIEVEIKDSMGTFTSISNFAFKPPGEGPFPAIVLMHTCGGIQNPHMRQHGQELLKEGYVVLMLDSFSPRGFESCPRGSVNVAAGVVDAYAALAFLSSQTFVDKSRIYQAGYSWGAIVATLLASPQSAAVAGSSLRFRATVSNYSTCIYQSKRVFVLKDTDRPVLMLLGERDEELPPSSCFPLLEEIKSVGAPVQWHVFPGASHGWDKQGQAGKGYVYNEATSKEATKRLLEFLSQYR